ncbi:ribosome maturation factor RimM [Idiomarina sp. OT37-5b]|jgi:16S rRNA processing protein RimM|uniref:Ribosome maturation factor RimM n=1 Tax=Idiomarina aquatica TaxID=1327752 RepID=A0AA94EEM4_9GAMM|nr:MULTISPECIES: ribosome maturation factor RimM [Idiomarina]AVJ56352.1 ribosome maturation factor RimM [Idiomarina sp. OT37-5b]RUO43127.1 ribosome maturation factor RimM [Idiomarina aquatica]
MAQSDNVVIGCIGAVYGVKGWLKIQSYTENPEDIFSYSPWYLQSSAARQQSEQAVTVVEWRRHNKGLIALIDGINDRDEASRLTGMEISIAADELPALAEDEFYWRDLIGMRVKNKQGYDMGVVEQIMPTPANDVLVVSANSNDAFGKSERLIPFVQSQYILAVDNDNQLIQVDWPADF